MKLHADALHPVEYSFQAPEPQVYFQIINVGGDTKVLSFICQRENGFYKAGFEKIIAIRDMYSDEYKKFSTTIDDEISRNFINGHDQEIQKLTRPERIKLFFAIMELEAWFLSFYNVFTRIDPILTTQYIEEQQGYNLENIDPQIEFFTPSKEVDNIYQLQRKRTRYTKKKKHVERFTSNMSDFDFELTRSKSKCATFVQFHTEILSLIAQLP